jgi:serine/threonine protein kinase
MQTGDVLRGKYRLVRLLGDGGMGSVYEAHHEGLGTRVAIKVLHPDLARRPGLVERFLREARVSAQIKSPNVVQVVDVERTEDGVAYIVMELLEGEPLSAVLERESKLSVLVASEYAGQILRALEAAHALGVVHRDLKPENVFVTTGHVAAAQAGAPPAPLLKLIDFGIAKARQMDSQARNLTIAGIVMGTPEYMAPEQAHAADKVDARSDIFAVGVMLYEMLAGSRPATGDDARIVALKVERGEVRPLVHAAPGVPPDLAGLVHRAMAPRPELRFGSAHEMRTALEATLPGKHGTTPIEPTAAALAAGAALNATGTTNRPSALPASVQERSSMVASQQAPAAGGRGTVMTDPSGGGLHAPSQVPQGHYGSAWPGAGGGAGVPPAYPAPRTPYPPAGARGRPRRQGSSTWILFGIPVLLGIGIVVAFALSNSSSSSSAPTAAPTSPSQVNVAPTPPASTAAPTQAPDPGNVPPLSPLNAPQAGPSPGPRPGPGPGNPGPGPSPSGAKPHPSASASAAPSAPPDSPFPFPGFPAIPNPFPSPSTSGMGPVITIPTSFPFPFPGGPSAPAPSASAAPAPSGKAI